MREGWILILLSTFKQMHLFLYFLFCFFSFLCASLFDTLFPLTKTFRIYLFIIFIQKIIWSWLCHRLPGCIAFAAVVYFSKCVHSDCQACVFVCKNCVKKSYLLIALILCLLLCTVWHKSLDVNVHDSMQSKCFRWWRTILSWFWKVPFSTIMQNKLL